jgi:SSS family solute:Na+ symporter
MSIAAWVGIALALYSLFMLAIGYVAWQRTRATPVDYFLGGRTVGAFAMIMTIAATYHSVFYFFGVAGYHYLHGFPTAPAILTMGTTMALSIWLFLPRFYLAGRAFGYITPGDYLADYYRSEPLRLVVALMTVVYMIPYLAIQPIGIAAGLESLTGGAIPYALGAFLFLLVMMLYTAFGGFRAVVWTDVVQGLIFFALAWAVGLWFLLRVGGGDLGGVFAKIAADFPRNMTVPGGAGVASWIWIFNFWLIFGLANGVQPQIWQRGYAMRSFRLFPVILVGLPIFSILGQYPNILSGLTGRAYVQGVTNPDTLVPYTLAQFAPGFGVVAMVAAIAASMSTVDSLLLTASSVVTRDLYERFLNRRAGPQALTRFSQAVVVALSMVAFLVSLTRPGLIIAFAAITWTGFAMLIPVVLGSFFWPRGNTAGALAGLIGGNVVDLALLASVWPRQEVAGVHFGLYGIATCTLLYVAVSLLTQPLPREHVERFHTLFRRVYAAGPEAARVPHPVAGD